jgi:hypothetical protein
MAIVSTVAALGISELMLRAFAYRPGPLPPVRHEPRMHAPDPVLGWRPIPGHWQFGPYSPGAPVVKITIRPDGARETGAAPLSGRPQYLLIGCSFTLGWAVSDDEPWASRLQQIRPDLEIVNRGVAGYGTLQSLLLLEELLRAGQRPARVLYGLIFGHEMRNTADPVWLRSLASYPSRGTVATPFVTLDGDGGLHRHAPTALLQWPFRHSLASAALLEDAWVTLRTADRGQDGVAATQLLIEEMARTCAAHGVGFSVVFLRLGTLVKAAYLPFLDERKIHVIDCDLPAGPEMSVRGEGHPSGRMHARWGDCVGAAVGNEPPLPAMGRDAVCSDAVRADALP